MKLKFRKRHVVIAAVNAAAIAGAAVLSIAGSSVASAQKYNYAYERWKGSGKDSYSQMSCFFNSDAGFTTDTIAGVRGQLLNELKNISVVPEEGQKLCPDAYSAPVGTAAVKCDVTGRSDAQVTAVGGDFFYFRDFTLIDGAFFTDSDIMQDGAVIDRELAWELYGSENVSGMNIYINGVKCYISGVIASPETDYEKKCIGKTPQAYVSYDMAAQIAPEAGIDGETGFTKVTCYECIIPDPVENFGLSKIKSIMKTYGDNVNIIRNDSRFAPSKRAKELKKLPNYAVRNDGIRLPWWENASRMTEFRLTYIYAARRVLFAVPILTLIWLAILAVRSYKRKKPTIKKKLSDTFEKIRLHFRNPQKSNTTEE